jgi:hypothetical protein
LAENQEFNSIEPKAALGGAAHSIKREHYLRFLVPVLEPPHGTVVTVFAI